MVLQSRMPSWHPQSKSTTPYTPPAPVPFESDLPQSQTLPILISTTPILPGYRIVRILGPVHGTTNAARKDAKPFVKNLTSNFGGGWGEARSMTSIIYQARNQAIDRLVKEAVVQGANAVIGLEIRENEILGCIIVSVNGTACWVEKEGRLKGVSAQEADHFP